MARISLFTTAALAALAAAAAPARAQEAEANVQIAAADDQDQGGRGGWRGRDVPAAASADPAPERSSRGDGGSWGMRAERQQQRAERQAQRVERQQQRAEVAPQGRNAPDGGWRSQRAGDGQRYGRNWDRGDNGGGAVGRPAPAWRGATPSTPDRGVTDQARAERWGERNRSYTDGTRNRTYREGVRDGRRLDNRQDRVENRDAYRSGYRAGTRADGNRDRSGQTYGYRQGYAGGSRDYRRWDRNDWRRDRRYDWYGYRSYNRSLFSIGRYYSPYRNYGYRRPSIGIFLDNGFYGNRYWIDDPWQYRLPAVYGPYRWVRYYDDVLLVDIYSGEVVDVIHDFFW